MTEQGLLDILAGISLAQAESAKAQAESAKTQALAQAKTEAVMAELGAAQAKTDLHFEEMSKVVAETSRKVEKVSKMYGGMSTSQGDFAENFFTNSLQRTLSIGGIEFDSMAAPLLLGKKGKTREFDIVMVNGASVAIVEVKYKANLADLDQVAAQIKAYRERQPAHKDFAIYAGLASLSVNRSIVKAARERGFFVLQQVGETMEVTSEGMRAH